MKRAMWRTAAAAALMAGVALGACGGTTVDHGGSETNWVATCATDDDCSAGVCACGFCTSECSLEVDCPGGGTLRCVTRGTVAHERVCQTVRDAPAGLCLAPCERDLDCEGHAVCEDGLCLPDSEWRRDFPEAATVGSPCVTADEKRASFPGYDVTEVNVETRSDQCVTGICLAYFFEGRTDCPYGGADCETPSGEPLTVDVDPQLVSRPPVDTVHCSCRCDGPAGEGPYCACPDGFECRAILPDYGLTTTGELLYGSYCIKSGAYVEDPALLSDEPVCDRALANCEDR